MKTQPILFILSDNQDFIEPVSALVTRELGLNCKSISDEADIQGHGKALVISERKLSDSYDVLGITVNFPIKINRLLYDIERAVSSLEMVDMVQIGDDLKLSLQLKMLSGESGESVLLTDKESHLLQIIAGAGDEGVSREILLKEVWKIDAVLDTHTLETHIYRLRKKIKDCFGSEMIKASNGGYKL